MSLQPGARLGPYEVVALLGTGGMGEVYRGRDPRLARDIAIKVLPTAVTADPDRLHRFEQEAKAAAALNHPNILAVYDIGQHNGSPYIVSELLEGQTLRAHLTHASAVARTAGQHPSQRRLPARKAVDYALQMVRGLSAAHDKGITHRDLKPENVFLTTDGQLKILDFGLAKLAEPASRRSTRRRRRLAPRPVPASCLARSATCLRSRCAARPPITARTSLPSGPRSTRCSRDIGRSTARRVPTR